MSDSFLTQNTVLNTIKMREPGVDANAPAKNNDSGVTREDPELRQAAEDFEAAFISQMLKFSGLGEALTKSGGEDVAAFTDFYIDNYAEKIVESGGFGLADKFYDKLSTRAGIKDAVMDMSSLSGGLDVRS